MCLRRMTNGMTPSRSNKWLTSWPTGAAMVQPAPSLAASEVLLVVPAERAQRVKNRDPALASLGPDNRDQRPGPDPKLGVADGIERAPRQLRPRTSASATASTMAAGATVSVLPASSWPK